MAKFSHYYPDDQDEQDYLRWLEAPGEGLGQVLGDAPSIDEVIARSLAKSARRADDDDSSVDVVRKKPCKRCGGTEYHDIRAGLGDCCLRKSPSLVIDIEKANKPYGHTAYTRHTKTGKAVFVKQKGVKPMVNPQAPYLAHPDEQPFHPTKNENDHKVWQSVHEAKPQSYQDTVDAIHGAIKEHFGVSDKKVTKDVVKHFIKQGAMHPEDHVFDQEDDQQEEQQSGQPERGASYFSFDDEREDADVEESRQYARSKVIQDARDAVADKHGVSSYQLSREASWRGRADRHYYPEQTIPDHVLDEADAAAREASVKATNAGEEAAERERDRIKSRNASKLHANKMLEEGYVSFGNLSPVPLQQASRAVRKTLEDAHSSLTMLSEQAMRAVAAVTEVDGLLEESDLDHPHQRAVDIDELGAAVDGVHETLSSLLGKKPKDSISSEIESPDPLNLPEPADDDTSEAVREYVDKLHTALAERSHKAQAALEQLYGAHLGALTDIKARQKDVDAEQKALEKKVDSVDLDNDPDHFVNKDAFPQRKTLKQVEDERDADEDEELDDDVGEEVEGEDDGEEAPFDDPEMEKKYQAAREASEYMTSHVSQLAVGEDEDGEIKNYDTEEVEENLKETLKEITKNIRALSKVTGKKFTPDKVSKALVFKALPKKDKSAEPAKKAKSNKASKKKVGKTGKVRSSYPGDSAKKPSTKQAPPSQKMNPVKVPDQQEGPPVADPSELATALNMSAATLQRIAHRFRDKLGGRGAFVTFMKTRLKAFARKHKLDGDYFGLVYDAFTPTKADA